MVNTDCKHWLGDRPCRVSPSCDTCTKYTPIRGNILLIEAGGLGSLLRVSGLANMLKTTYPDHQICLLTSQYNRELAGLCQSLDRVYCLEEVEILRCMAWEWVVNLESDPSYLSINRSLISRRISGFTLNSFGNIDVAEDQSLPLLQRQVDDTWRRSNQKPMQQLWTEALGLKWTGIYYDSFRDGVITSNQQEYRIGLNVGCKTSHNAKRWPDKHWIQLISILPKHYTPVILGGEDEAELCQEISSQSEIPWIDTRGDLNDYLNAINSCSHLVTGDTFGCHIGLSLGVQTILLAGPQPAQENGKLSHLTVLQKDIVCSPCFIGKAALCSNSKQLQCMQEILPSEVVSCL